MINTSLKFSDPLVTAKGEERAYVDLKELNTLWFNTGSICNLTCQNCYIESSPKNDRLSFITPNDVSPFLKEIKEQGLPTSLIGLTGGEPFANPHIIQVIELILMQGFDVLVLTNAYKVLKKHQVDLLNLKNEYQDKFKLRVSLDHYTKEVHEKERGENTFEETLQNIAWLKEHNFSLSIAGRTLFKEPLDLAVLGYENLLKMELRIGDNLIIFPEMDVLHNVPEITTSCWGILSKKPTDQMCASERMIIKKKGEDKAVVMPCTLLAYDTQFELGHSLKDAKERVYLNHPFCAKFCVLGGASCSPKIEEKKHDN
ncbi:MAG: radical SAM protein [Bacteriovoracaceae bacterium]|nr:radical SAM protein [Bacteriovoracaceae bacterium]